jgi:hypothetical protein
MPRQSLLQSGATAYAAGHMTEAEAAYRTMVAHDPKDAAALSNLAAVLTATERPEEAEAACRTALRAQARCWAALANLGNALHRQMRYPEAINAYHAAIEANPRNASAWTNLGVALNESWDMDNALIAHNAAVALAPRDAQIRTNRAMALLMAGQYSEGFQEFEWRWQTPGMAPHGLTQPQWQGANPSGQTVFLHAEGGFGDTLQFIRFAPLVASRGAHVVARVQTPLLGLLRRSFPDVTFVDDGTPPHDLHCPMLSLAAGFGTTPETIPADAPYLFADPERTRAWQSRLRALGPGLKIGLVWQGAPHFGVASFRAMNTRRSIPITALAPLAELPFLHLVSLQFASTAAPPPGMALFDTMAEVADFDDTAAIIANLDLVISVDSAVAHLAGALGKPVWVMSRFDACWRWLAHRTDSPWYPAMRLYRQAEPGDWAGLVARVTADLRAMAEPLWRQDAAPTLPPCLNSPCSPDAAS